MDLLVRRGTIGLGHVERDLASSESLEDDQSQCCEPQPPFDETHRETEAASDLFGRRPALDEHGECQRFIGGVHGKTVEVLRKARFGCGLVIGAENEARDLMVARQDLVLNQREHRAAAAFAGFDFEPALGCGPDHEVLQQAVRRNAGLEFGICGWIAMAADIAGGGN